MAGDRMSGREKALLVALVILAVVEVVLLLANRSDSQEQVWALGALVLTILAGLALVGRGRDATPASQDAPAESQTTVNGSVGSLENQGEQKNVAGSVGGAQIVVEAGGVVNYAAELARTPVGVPNNLPYSDSGAFVGREAELEKLHGLLQKQAQVAVCTGMGGVGKTELALQYASKYLKDYPGGVCWLPVPGQEVGTQLVAFARGLVPEGTVQDGASVAQQVAACFAGWPGGRVLLILDDVADLALVRPVLPGDGRFRVLLTSRESLLLESQRLELAVLRREAALRLLQELAGADRVQADPEGAENLCEWLGDLPLGLQLAGRYLQVRAGLSLAEMVALLQDEGLVQRAMQGRRDDASVRGVAAAFQLSWERLTPEARELLGIMGLFAQAPVEWRLVAAVWEAATGEALRDEELVYGHLVEPTGEKVYRLHPLVREFVRLRFGELPDWEGRQRAFAKVLVKEAQRIEWPPTRQLLEEMVPVVPHMKELATEAVAWLAEDDLLNAFTRLAWFYEGQADYEGSEYWKQKCCTETEERLGKEHPSYATSLNNLAALYREQGKYDDALPLQLEALERDRQYLPDDHPNIAIDLNNLAQLYQAQGKYDDALPLQLEALERDRQYLPDDHPDIAIDLNNLAQLYQAQGKYDDALPLQLEALERDRRTLPKDHPSKLRLNNLACLRRDMGDLAAALPLFEEALAIRQRVLPPEHPYIAYVRKHLADLRRRLGDPLP